MPDKEILNLRINNIDTNFVETMKPDQKIIIEIDRENKEFILREEADEEGSYALIDAEILD